MGIGNGAFVALVMLLLSAVPASAEFYRWVDKDGKEFFTNDAVKIPPEYRNSASTIKPDESRVSVGDKPVASDKPVVMVGEHKDKNGKGEEWWRRRAVNLRRQLADLQDEYAVLQKHEQDQERKQQKTIGKRKKTAASRDKKELQLEKKIAAATRRLEVELPEEARRADAYPGWIRE